MCSPRRGTANRVSDHIEQDVKFYGFVVRDTVECHYNEIHGADEKCSLAGKLCCCEFGKQQIKLGRIFRRFASEQSLCTGSFHSSLRVVLLSDRQPLLSFAALLSDWHSQCPHRVPCKIF